MHLMKQNNKGKKTELPQPTFICSSVIRQKSESQNGCYKKTKHAKISEKLAFLTP